MVRAFENKLRALAADEQGLSTVEYVVLLVLIVAMAVAAWNSFGRDVTSKLGSASTSFKSSVVGGEVQGAGSPTGARGPSGPRTIDAE
ncbi:MAG: hypothetical protein ABW352_00110 [Polyangiales bacterium]